VLAIGAPGTCRDEIERRCGVAHTLRAVEMRASRIHCSLAVRTVCPSCGAVGVNINKADRACAGCARSATTWSRSACLQRDAGAERAEAEGSADVDAIRRERDRLRKANSRLCKKYGLKSRGGGGCSEGSRGCFSRLVTASDDVRCAGLMRTKEVACMARRAKLTEEMVQQAIRLKADGLSNGDIICALGIHESTFYRWIGEPKNRLQRELSEGLKKEEAEFKHTLLTTIRAAALARNQYWTAAAWLLERKYPDEYGKADRRRDEDSEGGDAPRSCSAWWPSPCRSGSTSPRARAGDEDTSSPADGGLF
jgi:transposase